MRICLTHMRHADVGGTERYLNHLSRFLCERGHDVTIVCRSHTEAPHPKVRFEVLRSFALGPAWRRWSFATAVERHVNEHGRDYDLVLGLGRTWSQDVVRVGGGCYWTQLEAMSAGYLGAARGRTTRLRPTDRVALKIEAKTFTPGNFRRIIANSGMTRRDILARYPVDPACIEVIHNGVDTKRFNLGYRDDRGAEIRREAGFGPDDLVYLFLGSGFPRKGFDLMLEAFPAVLRQCPNARLLVVGHDSGQSAYERRAADLGVAGSIRFLGRRTDVEACYGAADVYVLPTRYDAFGFSVLEALASGLPVITTDTCGAGELIQSGVQGSIISVGGSAVDASAAVGRAMLEWVDRERIRGAATAARRMAEQHDIHAKLEATEHLLQRVAEEKRAAAMR